MSKLMSSRTRTLDTSAFIFYGVLTIGSIVMVTPFVWMLLSSFKKLSEIVRIPPTFFPHEFVLANYTRVMNMIPIWRYFLNSIVVGVVVTSIVLFSSSWAGYVFSKLEFKGKEIIFYSIISTMMIPFFVLLIPLYLMMIRVGWLDSYFGLILPQSVMPFGIFLMRQFMHEIPTSLIDSAKIDGASEVKIYYSIILPLTKPALSALGIFAFMWNWDSFLWPLVLISKVEMRTLPLGIAQLSFWVGKSYDLVLAASVMAAIPVIIVFLFFQKNFIKGIALSGLKG